VDVVDVEDIGCLSGFGLPFRWRRELAAACEDEKPNRVTARPVECDGSTSPDLDVVRMRPDCDYVHYGSRHIH
jgi:hypothetical protein